MIYGFRKPVKKAIWNTLGLYAVLTTCLRFSSVLEDACVACCRFLSTGSYHVCKQMHSTCCCFPRCTTEAFGSQKSMLWGETWMKVTGEPVRQAKKPRIAGLQQPACTHEDHQILSTIEAASFATQFCACKVHPTKAAQHEFLATCIDVDLEENVRHSGTSTLERGGIRQLISYRTVGHIDKSAKHSFALLQDFTQRCRKCGQGQGRCGCCHPP